MNDTIHFPRNEKTTFFFIDSLSNAPLINSSRGGIQLEVLATAIALRSSEKKKKNVPLCKHAVTSLPHYQRGDLKLLISSGEQGSLGISAWI